MSISQYDKEHFDEIIGGQGNWFTAQLIRLYCKADGANRDRLAAAFPDLKESWDRWYNGIAPEGRE